MHWALQYLGKPYQRGAQGPHAYDCWGLVRAVQSSLFGRDLPEVDVTSANMRGVVREFMTHVEHGRWAVVDQPAEGDCVELGEGRHPCHIGVWVEVDGGGVLHAVEGKGVVFSHRHVIAADWPLMLVWRFAA